MERPSCTGERASAVGDLPLKGKGNGTSQPKVSLHCCIALQHILRETKYESNRICHIFASIT